MALSKTAFAIIPARGGSKGIPGKNVKLLGGRPLIHYCIDAAKQAACIERVFVSTDDDEIAQVSEQGGAEVIRRPAALADDTASSESALLHALQALGRDAPLPQHLVFLQCTSPLTQAGDIDGTVNALIRQSADSALAVAQFHYYLWRHQGDGDGDAVGVNHDKNTRLMRQQQQAQYLETGSVYAMQTAGFLHHRHRFFGKTVMHVIPSEHVLEIDDPHDFLLAEARLQLMATTVE